MAEMASKVIELKPVDTKGETIKLGIGRHIIGRGPLLRCADKRISRNHAVIDIKPDGSITLESTHANPCFYQKLGETDSVTLTKFSSQEVQVGDRFSLMPFSFTYEVFSNSIVDEESGESDRVSTLQKNLSTDESKPASRAENAEDATNDPTAVTIEVMKKRMTTEKIGSRKRILPSWLIDLANQKDDEGEDKPSGSSKKVTEKKGGETATEGTSKRNTGRKQSPKNKKTNEEEEDKKQPTTGNPTPMGKKRKSCRFGSNCYRKNPVHFQEESHPGDPDYISPSTSDTDVATKEDDDDDNRPECEYGVNCYRKNPQHRKQYKHTHVPRPPRTAAKKAKAKNKALQSDEDDDDDFIVDDDSDAYNPESEADTDDDVETLLAEANEFKRNKKMLKPT